MRGAEDAEFLDEADLGGGGRERHRTEVAVEDAHPGQGPRVVAGEQFRAQRAGVVDALRVGGEGGRPDVVLLHAVGVRVSDPGRAQRLDARAGVVGGIDAVAAVQDRRHARVEGFQGADRGGGVQVLGADEGADAVERGGEELRQRLVGGRGAQQRHPGVPVAVYQAGQDDAAAGVDAFGVGAVQLVGAGGDGGDAAVLDQHGALGVVAECGVHGDHLAAGDQGAPGAHAGLPDGSASGFRPTGQVGRVRRWFRASPGVRQCLFPQGV
ncbi:MULTISPECIES: hypothetical protein [unclassified Streptomyces]|uniref:hypothetical protein n=1 Tax=unclassified Streptomyces TaxID=2593676 RepID=UPI00278C66E7|nr:MULTISPECIES: hypothetical protein [unclassified Streptomyces]